MLRILAAILLMQLLAQASGLVYAAQGLACEDASSEGSRGDEDCGSGCADCLCCPQHRLLGQQPVSAPTVLAVDELVFPGIAFLLAGGLPRDIMHVPKARATG